MNTTGDEEALIYNNGIVEFILPLEMYVSSIKEGLFFYNDDVWNYIENVTKGYRALMPKVFGKQRYFGCICIIGCKDLITEDNGYGRHKTQIDRNEITCRPIVFTDILEEDSFYSDLGKLNLEYFLSVGIRKNKKVKELIDSILDE